MSLFLLGELVIVLAASIAVIVVCNKMKVPAVVGFLLTGILIGPGGFSLVKDTHTIDILAEVGVVMLLFTIGMEFSLDRLKKMRKSFFLGGGLQVVITIGVVALAVGSVLGIGTKEAVFYGFLISLSSTAVVMKLLSDRNEVDSPPGRVSFGILLFQDLAVVPMIAIVPVLTSVGSVSVPAIAVRFAVSILAIGAVFFISRNVMPMVLGTVVRTRIREIFLMAALLACFGLALLTSALGLSLALGAFLAGLIISESEYSHQVISEVMPLKDLFNSIFFISIGMMLNTAAVWTMKWNVLAIVVSILLIKALVVLVTVRLLGYDRKTAFITGLGLAEIGEFSFVLAGVGRTNGFLAGDAFQVFIASSILTIMAVPVFMRWAPALADRLFPEREGTTPRKGNEAAAPEDHVIIAGFGLNGRNLARVLKGTGLPYVILELNPETFKAARAAGEPIIFGNASSRTILAQAGIRKARGVVLALSDPSSCRRAVSAAKSMNREAFVIARTRYAAEIDELFALGADDVIPEEYETSIEIFSRVLDKFHVPRNVINLQVQLVRNECYGLLRGTCSGHRPMSESIPGILTIGTVETYFVPNGAWFMDMPLGEIDLRGKTGATVAAVVRGERSHPGPGADFVLRTGDILVIVADHKGMDRAFGFLESGAGVE